MTKKQFEKLQLGDEVKINYPGSWDHGKKGYVHRIEDKFVYFCSADEYYDKAWYTIPDTDGHFNKLPYKFLDATGYKKAF